MTESSGRLRLSEVNQHLVCVLCGGYFIDATTIVECLHSFCRSCLIKYLETNSFCPICDVQIHKAKPFLNIKPDKALQDIVYKLVPGLFHSEMRRRREFYAQHPERMHETTPEGRGVGVERLIYSPDDSISLSLEYLEGEEGEELGCTTSQISQRGIVGGVKKRYLQCPALVTIGHLKKFLRVKFELTSAHTVEVIHRRESLPDNYTLMDVAYIYTWKRNGPMRFFFRITQCSTADNLPPQHPALVSNGPAAEQKSPVETTQISFPSTTMTPAKAAPLSKDHDSAHLPPKPGTKLLDTRTSDLPVKALANVRANSSTVASGVPADKPAVVSKTQSASIAVTTVTPSLPVPSSVTSVSSTVSVPSSQSIPTACSLKEASKSVNKPIGSVAPCTVALTKTTPSTRTISSLLSPIVSSSPARSSEVNISRSAGQQIEAVTGASSQQLPPTTKLALPQQQTAVTATKYPMKQLLANGERTLSKPLTKELDSTSSSAITKTQNPSLAKENGHKSHNQISLVQPVGNNSSQKVGQILNGNIGSGKELLTPFNKSQFEAGNCKTQSQQEKPMVICKTEPEESATSSIRNSVPVEQSGKSTPNLAYVNPNTVKTIPTKNTQQRLQISNRKTSQSAKLTPDPGTPMITPIAIKSQLQATKDPIKFPRANLKTTDKASLVDTTTVCKKEMVQIKTESGDRKEPITKESSEVITNSMVEKPSGIITNTPCPQLPINITSSNSKVCQPSQELIRNNQQILKKNDEIMRCVTTAVKRPMLPVPRKTSDVLKNCSVQLRSLDDKSIPKKRRVNLANTTKRPSANSLEVNKVEEMQSNAKKSRLGIENNRKLTADQKPPLLKIRCTPNAISGQNSIYATVKSEPVSESSSNNIKNNNNKSHTPTHASTSDHKANTLKSQGDKKIVINEKAQPNTPIQRSQSNSQTNATSKSCVSTTSHPVIKPEPPSKVDISSSTPRGSPSNSQNPQAMSSPPVPVVAHSNVNPRLCPTPIPSGMKGKAGVDPDGAGALDLSASPRRQQQQSILTIAQTLARRQQQQCPSPAPPPLSPLSSLSPFPVIPSVPVRSPPPQLRIPVPPHHRSAHPQQQRPSSLSSSSPSPPADTVPGSSRMGPPQQQQQQQQSQSPADVYASHLLPPAALMFRQQLELQRLWGGNKHSPTGMDWFNDANSIKRFETFMKTLQQQGGRNSSFYPFNNNNNNNTTAAASNHRK